MTDVYQDSAKSQTPRIVELVLTHTPEAQFLGGAANCRPPLEEGLVGWVMNHAEVDAGVPRQIQRILSRALCHIGAVTFLDSTVDLAPGTPWNTTPRGDVRVVAPARFHTLKRRSSFPLRCTRDPEVIEHMFDDVTFSWEQEGQVALVSLPTGGLLDLDHALVDTALDPRRTEEVFGVMKAHLVALMRPGPDGDFAHFVVRHEVAMQLWERLSELCADMSIAFRVMDGPSFSQMRWFTQSIL